LKGERAILRGAIILAGGRSLRFGGNKALANLRNKPLITYAVNAVLKITKKIVVVVKDNDEKEIYRKILPKNVMITSDILKIQSPLVGMLTGMNILNVNNVNYAIVLPCDCPFINTNVIKYLFKVANNGFDAVIPRWPNGCIEPLHSIYKIKVASQLIKEALRKRELKILNVINQLERVAYVSVNELKRYDSKLLSFFNINTLNDLKTAESILNSFP
jgi:molybdopterin-guanine dinucleotide biosynthesis protein A